MSVNLRPPVIIDNGTGFTKMGYAGNVSPQIVIPTVMAAKGMDSRSALNLSSINASSTSKSIFGTNDIDIPIGNVAMELAKSKEYSLLYPVRHGQICDWDLMERYWQTSIFEYLKCEPEDHLFLLTEPPMNAPENRAMTAEIAFESFNVAGLHIAVQAVLALSASWAANPSISNNSSPVKPSLTGTVIDSGDGVTHVIPVVDGFVIGSAIQSIPIAGKDVTFYIQSLLRERGAFPQGIQSTFDTSRMIKEKFCYTCSDPNKEKMKLSESPLKAISEFVLPDGNKIILGDERFMSSEVFFSPSLISQEYDTPLPNLVDNVIQSCPIDSRRGLYGNIVLSGGSTLFKDFGRRIQKDLKFIVQNRLQENSSSVDVNVISHQCQKHAVWYGGSLLASTAQFPSVCHLKSAYNEHGPNIFRQSIALNKLF